MLYPIVSQNSGLLLAHFIGRPLGVNFDRPVLDFSGKVAHVLTAQRRIPFDLHASQDTPRMVTPDHL